MISDLLNDLIKKEGMTIPQDFRNFMEENHNALQREVDGAGFTKLKSVFISSSRAE